MECVRSTVLVRVFFLLRPDSDGQERDGEVEDEEGARGRRGQTARLQGVGGLA